MFSLTSTRALAPGTRLAPRARGATHRATIAPCIRGRARRVSAAGDVADFADAQVRTGVANREEGTHGEISVVDTRARCVGAFDGERRRRPRWGRDGVSVVPGPIYPREYAGEETFGL